MSNTTQLSLDESQEIAKMMESNKKQVESDQTSPTPEQAQAEIKKAYQGMKKLLKFRSKTDLIELIWTYGVQLQEMQRVAQMLLEENKLLKGESSND